MRWYVDYNHEQPDPATGLPVGTLRIPSFLKHRDRFIDSRAILSAPWSRRARRLAALLAKHPARGQGRGLRPRAGRTVRDRRGHRARVLGPHPGRERRRPRASRSPRSCRSRTGSAPRAPCARPWRNRSSLLERYGLAPEMGHKEVGGIKATVSGEGGFDGIMEQLEVDWRYAERAAVRGQRAAGPDHDQGDVPAPRPRGDLPRQAHRRASRAAASTRTSASWRCCATAARRNLFSPLDRARTT